MVPSKVKSGKIILNDFFDKLSTIPGTDAEVSNILLELYREQKLTSKNLANALLRLRQEAVNDQDS